MELKEFFTENPVIALGFSGGVDSSYLLYAALHYGAKVKAYFLKTAFQPQFELDDAMRLAKQLHADLTILSYDVTDFPEVIANPADRCYHCKTALFTAMQKQALADGCPLLIDGTNASDEVDNRTGMKALTELSVRSPLRECGLTKDDVRRLSKEAGLPSWNKPSYACLATRVPTGKTITVELLQRVEAAENELFAMGFTDFRCRVYNDAARLQFPEGQLMKAIQSKDEIINRLKPTFKIVLLDLEGR
ncbi:MAG: ATP-dependent sacrificial sulfur transferase LarE [Erysipelotrichales bacterium]|nr:MAG: ATP-dependent sacrificial sulfur transferase LarE [Erysipelotrichales bacterium]